MRDYLNRQGFPVNRKRVQRLMRLMGIESVAPKPNTSKPRREYKVYPYLLKKFTITEPDQVWCSDYYDDEIVGEFVADIIVNEMNVRTEMKKLSCQSYLSCQKKIAQLLQNLLFFG